MSIDPKTNWLGLYNKSGIAGIETALVCIIRESGFINLSAIYKAFSKQQSLGEAVTDHLLGE